MDPLGYIPVECAFEKSVIESLFIEAQVHGSGRSQEGPDPDRLAHFGRAETQEDLGIKGQCCGVCCFFFNGM